MVSLPKKDLYMEELIFVIGELLVTETNLIESVVYPREKEYPNNLLAISKDGKKYEIAIRALD
ncbi:MAG TPA: hypothetical protein GX745_00135 [Clostridiales bacterium]|nr:hypothetical protein [Clostridiales bacterium]